MKTEIISNKEESILRVTRRATLRDQWNTGKLLDHAWLRKDEISYNQEQGILTAKVQRYGLLRRVLGRIIWSNTRPPKISSILIIKAIEDCEICDKDPDNQDLIIGRLVIENDNTIFLGSFCEHENPFHIVLKVRSINISLEDI